MYFMPNRRKLEFLNGKDKSQTFVNNKTCLIYQCCVYTEMPLL